MHGLGVLLGQCRKPLHNAVKPKPNTADSNALVRSPNDSQSTQLDDGMLKSPTTIVGLECRHRHRQMN